MDLFSRFRKTTGIPFSLQCVSICLNSVDLPVCLAPVSMLNSFFLRCASSLSNSFLEAMFFRFFNKYTKYRIFLWVYYSNNRIFLWGNNLNYPVFLTFMI